MRFILIFLWALLSCITSYSQQNKPDILDADLNTFQNFLQNKTLDRSKWEELRQKALLSESNHEYEKALAYATKAKLLSEKLTDNLLIARSWHLIGKAYPKTPEFQTKEVAAFKESYNRFINLEKTLDSRKWAGFLFNDWAQVYSNPEYSHSADDIKTAFTILFNVYQMIERYPSPDKKELGILTALNISNCFYDSGHIPAQIAWIEYAAREFASVSESIDKNLYFAVNLQLQKAYRRTGEYEKAFNCLKSLDNWFKKNQNDFLKLDYLFDLQDAYSDIGKSFQMFSTIEQGLLISSKVNYRHGEFYAMKIKRLLQAQKVSEAQETYKKLSLKMTAQGLEVEKIDLAVIKAVIAGYEGNEKLSDEYFKEGHRILNENLGKDWSRALFLLNWEATMAIFQKNYYKLERITQEYLSVASDNNQKDSLPWIYLAGAKAQIGFGNLAQAREFLLKAINFIEAKRQSDLATLSIGVMEVLFEAYQLRIELELNQNNIEESFQTSELLKSRWLQDKISNNRFTQNRQRDQKKSRQIFETSKEFLEKPFDSIINTKLASIESNSLFDNSNSGNELPALDSTRLLENNLIDDQTAIVTYAFTTDKLIAFVYAKGKKVEALRLDLSLAQADKISADMNKQIKNGIYFKENGKQLFDLLLKPLNLEQFKHLIIIPDKSLWKIPFQVLSAEGKKFLIEDYQISYAPSVSVLTKYLTLPKPSRQSFQVFSNARFDNLYLLFADREAKSLAMAYGVDPYLNSTIEEFTKRAVQSDIVHFSMHAEIDKEDLFESFLAFNKSVQYPNGKLSVNEILSLKLKQQSLVFLASCATDNILNGEGLVSLAWGMMNAGATTVISTQWEANDESTEQFTKRFYQYYKQGFSGAESLQKASIEMIHSPDPRFNKPAHWAEFTLNGDFR